MFINFWIFIILMFFLYYVKEFDKFCCVLRVRLFSIIVSVSDYVWIVEFNGGSVDEKGIMYYFVLLMEVYFFIVDIY